MMNSMTGFGRSEDKNENIQCSVEIKTVNSRYRDIFLKLPFALNILDSKIRSLIQEKLTRGKIDVFVSFTDYNPEHSTVVLNKGLAKEYIKILNQLVSMDSMIEDSISLSLLAGFPDVIGLNEISYDEEELWKQLEPVFRDAVEQVAKARYIEGEHLKQDMLEHADNAKELIQEIKKLAPAAIENSTQNIHERLKKALGEIQVDEMRFLNEAAIQSDKLAIDEEITRLESHLQRFYELSELDEPIGRKMDFLLQELNRETNTIGAKTDNLEISNLVVDLKSELEKIREQVQNIE